MGESREVVGRDSRIKSRLHAARRAQRVSASPPLHAARCRGMQRSYKAYLLLSDLLLDGGGVMPLLELLEALPPDGLLDIPPLLDPVPALPLVLPAGGFMAPDVSRDCFVPVSGPLLHAVNDIATAIMVAVNNNLFFNMLSSLCGRSRKGRAARRGGHPFPWNERGCVCQLFQRATKLCNRCTVIRAGKQEIRPVMRLALPCRRRHHKSCVTSLHSRYC